MTATSTPSSEKCSSAADRQEFEAGEGDAGHRLDVREALERPMKALVVDGLAVDGDALVHRVKVGTGEGPDAQPRRARAAR